VQVVSTVSVRSLRGRRTSPAQKMLLGHHACFGGSATWLGSADASGIADADAVAVTSVSVGTPDALAPDTVPVMLWLDDGPGAARAPPVAAARTRRKWCENAMACHACAWPSLCMMARGK
jgi:hypothetical protein